VNLPCYECIVLAICKSKERGYEYLSDKCTILSRYVEVTTNRERKERLKEFRKVFGSEFFNRR
jgi:hypothetical protein